MRFDQLLPENEIIRRIGPIDIDIEGLTYKSQDVKSGWLFAAIPGSRVDGHSFVSAAVDAGASALIVKNPPSNLPENVAVAVVDDPRRALAKTAGRFYGHPSRRMKLVGITGTNGKTTTAFLIESILREGNRKPTIIGTINYRLGDTVRPAPVTTPESVDLQSILAETLDMGADSGVIEVSSHALHQGRVWGLKFAARIFTNLSRDHLDYHGSMEEYFNAKSILFLNPEFKDSGPAVVNADDPWGEKLIRELDIKTVSYGIESTEADVRAVDLKYRPDGVRFRIITPTWEDEIESELLGRVNIYNILAATASAQVIGIEPEFLKAGVESLRFVPGRLEPVLNSRGITVIVDYSHTPDSLEKAMRTLREFTAGKLFVVFGCGGDRDRGKRSIMGRLAAEIADAAVVTSDNPRTEDPMDIIGEILEGVRETGKKRIEPGIYPNGSGAYWVEPDRHEAISQAIKTAREGDSVLIAGKGHEDYQIIGAEKIHFDDREVAREVMEG